MSAITASVGSGAAKRVWQPTAHKTALLEPSTPPTRLLQALWALQAFLAANDASLVNYTAHYRLQASASQWPWSNPVNRVIERRMTKKQPMRWSRRGAHRRAQLRVAVRLPQAFQRWYPRFEPTAP
jgi:hypothetical protein